MPLHRLVCWGFDICIKTLIWSGWDIKLVPFICTRKFPKFYKSEAGLESEQTSSRLYSPIYNDCRGPPEVRARFFFNETNGILWRLPYRHPVIPPGVRCLIPIPSMGLVYLPTFYHILPLKTTKCRYNIPYMDSIRDRYVFFGSSQAGPHEVAMDVSEKSHPFLELQIAMLPFVILLEKVTRNPNLAYKEACHYGDGWMLCFWLVVLVGFDTSHIIYRTIGFLRRNQVTWFFLPQAESSNKR